MRMFPSFSSIALREVTASVAILKRLLRTFSNQGIVLTCGGKKFIQNEESYLRELEFRVMLE